MQISSKCQTLPKSILRHGSNNAFYRLLQNRKNPFKLTQFTKAGKGTYLSNYHRMVFKAERYY